MFRPLGDSKCCIHRYVHFRGGVARLRHASVMQHHLPQVRVGPGETAMGTPRAGGRQRRQNSAPPLVVDVHAAPAGVSGSVRPADLASSAAVFSPRGMDMIKRGVSFSTLLLACATTVSAQLISIRTVPVSQGHQFDLFPSSTMPMGGVSIALPDSLLDPFTNPAQGTRLQSTRFVGSPSVYSVSSGAGGGRTLPLGALTRLGSWYGGVWFAIQEVDLSDRMANVFDPFPGPSPLCPACSSVGIDFNAVEKSHGNTYAFASLGKDLSDRGLSVGASVTWSGLNAIDGVDLLYAGR